MSLFAAEAYQGADFVEIPCEFCNELYPLELLMEHQSGCRPDLLHFNYEDEVAPIAPVAGISSKAPAPPNVTENMQKSSALPKAPTPSFISRETSIPSSGKKNVDDKTSKVDPFEDLLKDDDDEIPIIFEDNSQIQREIIENRKRKKKQMINAPKKTKKVVEIPCEFCNELYPFELLMEHQSGCRPDLLHFNFEDEVVPVVAIASKAPAPPKVTENKQKSPALPKALTPSFFSRETSIPSSGKKNIVDKTSKVNHFEDLLKDDDDEIQIIFEDNSQESGVKLMSYGSSVGKRTEEEKPSFRPPPLPLFNDQTESKDSSNIISDDEDCGESLEDFWRRADIKNTQRLRKLKN